MPSRMVAFAPRKQYGSITTLPEITTPTLLVSGRHDEATPLIVGQIQTTAVTIWPPRAM